MVVGLLAALASCVCYGVASTLQALGARRVESGPGVDPRLLVRVLRSLPFVGGLCLDTVGLAFNLVALRSLPLFTTQAVVNTNLAITALAAVPLLGARLAGRDKAAVAAVVGGLIMLGFASGKPGHGHFDTEGKVALLICSVALSAAALIIGNV
jgi:drug/metabolite transporter (DMT)-like permease